MSAQLSRISKEKITSNGSTFVPPQQRKGVKINHKGRVRLHTTKNREDGEAVTVNGSAIRLAKERADPQYPNPSPDPEADDTDSESSDPERDRYITTNERGHKITANGSAIPGSFILHEDTGVSGSTLSATIGRSTSYTTRNQGNQNITANNASHGNDRLQVKPGTQHVFKTGNTGSHNVTTLNDVNVSPIKGHFRHVNDYQRVFGGQNVEHSERLREANGASYRYKTDIKGHHNYTKNG